MNSPDLERSSKSAVKVPVCGIKRSSLDGPLASFGNATILNRMPHLYNLRRLASQEEYPVLVAVSQTTKINLLLLNVIVVVVANVVVRFCLEVLSALEFLAQH